jgi:hypothetical protein
VAVAESFDHRPEKAGRFSTAHTSVACAGFKASQSSVGSIFANSCICGKFAAKFSRIGCASSFVASSVGSTSGVPYTQLLALRQ